MMAVVLLDNLDITPIHHRRDKRRSVTRAPGGNYLPNPQSAHPLAGIDSVPAAVFRILSASHT